MGGFSYFYFEINTLNRYCIFLISFSLSLSMLRRYKSQRFEGFENLISKNGESFYPHLLIQCDLWYFSACMELRSDIRANIRDEKCKFDVKDIERF